VRIEDIILAHDQRGISALRSHLPDNYCEEAARLLVSQQGTVFITTGFYIVKAQAAETDGPPGVIALGRASSNWAARRLCDRRTRCQYDESVGWQRPRPPFPQR